MLIIYTISLAENNSNNNNFSHLQNGLFLEIFIKIYNFGTEISKK